MKSRYVFTAILFLAFCVSAYGVEVSVPELSAAPGDTVTVGVSVDDATGVAGADIELEYDATILEAKEARATALATGLSMISNVGVAGMVTISMAGANGLAGGSGVLIEVDFAVKADASGESALTLSYVALYNEQALDLPDVTAVNGKITVESEEEPEPVVPRRLSISDADGKAGEVIGTTVHIDDLTDVAGADITLVYDSTMVSVEEVTSTELLAGMTVIVNTDVEDKIIIAVASATGAKEGTGTIFNIFLKAKEDVSGETELAFESAELFDENSDGIEVETGTSGKIRIAEVVKGPEVVREHESGSSMLALEAVYNEANVHGYAYVDIWEGSMLIEVGMFLEFQVAMFSGNPTFSGTIDLHTSDGSNLRDSGAKDQNDVSAHPGAVLSEYARDQWYHRKISLDALAGKTLDGVMIATDSNHHTAGMLRAYVDNIQITDGEHILTEIYMDEETIPLTGEIKSTRADFAGTDGTSDYSVTIVGETPVTPAGKLVSSWGHIKVGE